MSQAQPVTTTTDNVITGVVTSGGTITDNTTAPEGGVVSGVSDSPGAQAGTTDYRNPLASASPMTICDRCGSDQYRDVDIHGNYSVRRQCRLCGRFMGWPKWYGLDLTEASETVVECCQRILDDREVARLQRVQKLLGSNDKLKTAAQLFDYEAATAASASARRAG